MKHEDQNNVYGGISTTNAGTFTNLTLPLPPSGVVDATGAPPAPGRGVDDFRPTAPRHSPGVGHSIHN